MTSPDREAGGGLARRTKASWVADLYADFQRPLDLFQGVFYITLGNVALAKVGAHFTTTHDILDIAVVIGLGALVVWLTINFSALALSMVLSEKSTRRLVTGELGWPARIAAWGGLLLVGGILSAVIQLRLPEYLNLK